MKFIDGIPINWDGIEDGGLFGKNLFGQSNQNTALPGTGLQQISNNSLFKDSPFGENWDTRQVVSYLMIDDEDDFGQDPDPQKPVENRIIYHTYIDVFSWFYTNH